MGKIRDKVNNNEKIIFLKKLWANKKFRAWLWLGIYFVFFLVISILLRMSSGVSSPDTNTESKYDITTIIENLNNISKSDYNYKILIGDEELVGSVNKGVNSFNYKNNTYIFIYDKLYLQTDSNLELINNLFLTDIPVENITIDNVINYISDLQYTSDSVIKDNFDVIYNIPISKILADSGSNYVILRLIGNNNITSKVIISYNNSDYILNIY